MVVKVTAISYPLGIRQSQRDYGVASLMDGSRTVSAMAAELNVGVTVSTNLCIAEC